VPPIAYSVSRNALVLEGGPTAPNLVNRDGVSTFANYHSLKADIAELTGRVSSSVLGEAWAEDLE
jgi:hypothetical protein